MSEQPIAAVSKDVPIGLLDEPTLMSRIEIEEQPLEELAADIRRNGLINPIAVVPNGERYRILAGHRRYLACTRAGLAVVPVRVFSSEEEAAESIKFSENFYRKDLTPAEEAVWFAELLEGRCGGDVDRLCALLKQRRAFIEGRLLLLSGDEHVFNALRDGKINVGVANKLNEIGHELERRYYLDAAIRGGATVAIVTAWVAEWKARQAPARQETPGAPVAETGIVYAPHDFSTCYICRKSDPRFIPMPINVHQHCQHAILDPLLDSYHGTEPNPQTPGDPRRI